MRWDLSCRVCTVCIIRQCIGSNKAIVGELREDKIHSKFKRMKRHVRWKPETRRIHKLPTTQCIQSRGKARWKKKRIYIKDDACRICNYMLDVRTETDATSVKNTMKHKRY